MAGVASLGNMQDGTLAPLSGASGGLPQNSLGAERKPGLWKRVFHKRSLSSSPAKVELPWQESSVPGNGRTADEPGGATPAPVSPSLSLFHPREEALTDYLSDDAIIKRFEPLLAHCPRNIKILTTLAEACARKMMFDKSLSFYERALEIGGGKRPDIEKAFAETTLQKLDLELSQLDPKSPDYATQRERIQNERLEHQWEEMEKV